MYKLTVLILFLFAGVIVPPAVLVSATQSADNARSGKFAHAIVRSEDSAKILSLLNELSTSDFPKELADKAEGIAVFPRVDHEKVMFMQSTRGYGVICARGEKGWSLPAFYRLDAFGFTGDVLAQNEIAVVLLFMNKNAIAWFDKGRIGLETPKNIVAGPVGTLTEQQKKDIESAMVLGYVFDNSHLFGMKFGKRFKMQLDQDNNVNNPLYGMKGREVLAGRSIDSAKVPAGIVAFQAAVTKYHSVK